MMDCRRRASRSCYDWAAGSDRNEEELDAQGCDWKNISQQRLLQNVELDQSCNFSLSRIREVQAGLGLRQNWIWPGQESDPIRKPSICINMLQNWHAKSLAQ